MDVFSLIVGAIIGFIASIIGSILMWLIFGPRIVSQHGANQLFDAIDKIESEPESREAIAVRKLGKGIMENLPDIESRIEDAIPDGKKLIEGVIDDIINPENKKELKDIPITAKIGLLGNIVINPLLYALQNPEDKEGRKIMESLLANAWKTVEESTWFKQSFKQWIRQNSNFVIKTVVEEASNNPELIKDVIQAYVDVQKEQGGGAGKKIIKKKIEEEGIWGIIDMARDLGMF